MLNAAMADRRAFDLEALLRAGTALHGTLDLPRLCRQLASMMRERTGHPDVSVWVAQGHATGDSVDPVLTRQCPLPDGEGAAEIRVGDGMFWQLIVAGHPVSVVDLDGQPRFPLIWSKNGLNQRDGSVWVPMVLNGRVIGLVTLGGGNFSGLKPEDTDFVTHLAAQAAVAFHTSGLYDEHGRASRELARSMHHVSLLFEVSRAVSAGRDLGHLLKLILAKGIEAVNAERGSLMLLNDSTEELEVKVVGGLPDAVAEREINEGIRACQTFKRGEGVAGQVLATGKAVRVDHAATSTTFARGTGGSGGSAVRTILCVPLIVEQECIGVLNLTNRKDNLLFREEDESVLVALANQAAQAISRTRLYEAAITDGMTGLYIRRFAMQRLHTELKRARRYQTPVSVIMCDIDHFKRVNDTYGHPAGDAVIIAAAKTLRAGVRTEVDLACRFGGEEFVLILPNVSADAAKIAAERLREAIEAMRVEAGTESPLNFTMSFGVAELAGADADAEALLKRADEALYASKHGGRNQVSIAPAPVGLVAVGAA
jgi:diguanylate cyclase (GGDEF)-like protein